MALEKKKLKKKKKKKKKKKAIMGKLVLGGLFRIFSSLLLNEILGMEKGRVKGK